MKLSILFSRIFSLSIALTFANHECDHFYSEILENQGFISSNNYPFEYLHNLACRYTFHMKPRLPGQGAKICFMFYEFDIEPNVPFCLFDFLEFQSSPPIKYCANGVWHYGASDPDYPQSTLTSGYSCWNSKNKFVLKFSSDNSSNGRGFYATYKILDSSEAEPASEPSQNAELGKTLMKCSFSWKSKEDDDVGSSCSVSTEGWKKTESLFLGSTFIDDHTVGAGGSFLLSSKNMKSLLLGPEIPLNSDLPYCVTFWFLFASPQSPGLKVFISKDQMHALPEWESRPSDAMPTWRLGEISLSGLTSIQVAMATDVPDSHWPEGSLGVVAIDDLAISVGQCGRTDISCNFESSSCNWLSVGKLDHSDGVLTANGDWQRPAEATDPNNEEDFRGNYISAMAPDDRDLTRSLLVSPQVTSSVGHAEVDGGSIQVQPDGKNSTFYHSCFKFFYRFGESDGLSRLNVRLIRHDNYLTPAIWSATNHVQGNWISASADLALYRDKPYKVVFESLLRSGSRVFVDGFSVDPERCTTPTSECLSTNGLQCGSGLCIDASKVCDRKEDCTDGSDEDETAGCREGRRIFTDFPTSVDGLISDSSLPFADHNSTPRSGVNILAASLSAAVLGLLLVASLALLFIFLTKRNTSRSVQKSPGNNKDKNKNVSGKGVQDEDLTIYQTLSASNQSSANLCWVNGEERGLRAARCSSSSDDGSDVAIVNINDRRNHSSLTHKSAKRLEASLRSDLPPQSAVQSMRREVSPLEPSTHVLDAQALRGHTPAPLIVTSKYIISPDKAGAFVPGLTDRQRINQMIESYRKDIKIPNMNSSSSFDRPSEVTKDFRIQTDGCSLSDHVYEDIDETKVRAGVQTPFSAYIEPVEGRCHLDIETFPGIAPQVVLEKGTGAGQFSKTGGIRNGQIDSSIISKAILV